MVLVSVIMASYNHEKFISDAIESVLNQSYKDFELIIIDDYSKDNSKEIINEYVKVDKRIKVLLHRKNQGISRARNDGFDIAEGKYIAFIDSDDVWVSHKLEIQLSILEQDENLIVWSEGDVINEKGRYLGRKVTAPYTKKSGNLFYELLNTNKIIIFVSSMIFNKNHLRNIRFNEKLKYDNDCQFYVELARNFNFFFIREPLAKYRLHSENTRVRISLQKRDKYKDRVKLNLYFLKTFKHELSKNLKWKIYTRLIIALLELNRKKVRIIIFSVIKAYPFKYLNYFYLMKCFVNTSYFSKFLLKFQKLLNISL